MLLRGNDVVVKDLNSTNGTFINGEQVTESPLKPGQILRLGQVEMRLETEAPAGAAVPRKPLDQTMVIQGREPDNWKQGPRRGFDTQGRFHQEEQQGQQVSSSRPVSFWRGHRGSAPVRRSPSPARQLT